MNRAELKSVAKQQIKGKIGSLFLIELIIFSITLVLRLVAKLFPLSYLAYSIIIGPAFTLSITRVYLAVVKGGTPTAGDVFTGFDDFWASFKLGLLTGLLVLLWSLLLIIPGIIKGISYSMSTYVLAENPGMSASECIEESMYMTDGHKKDLFVLSLSFIGWGLLCAITFGIAYIWVAPYMRTTYANAYETLKPPHLHRSANQEAFLRQTAH